MSLANIALVDKEIRELCKMARNVSTLSPIKEDFAELVCRKTFESIFEEKRIKIDPERTVARVEALNKAELILTGRLIEEMKRENPNLSEDELLKQSEAYAKELRTGMDRLNRKTYTILDDFTTKLLNKAISDRTERFEKLTSDESLDKILFEEIAMLPESIAKGIVEDIAERLYKKHSKPEVEVKTENESK